MSSWPHIWNNIVYNLQFYNGVTTVAVGIVTLITFFVSCATCCMMCSQRSKQNALTRRVHPMTINEPERVYITAASDSARHNAGYLLVPNNGCNRLAKTSSTIMASENNSSSVPNPPRYIPETDHQQQQPPPQRIYPNI